MNADELRAILSTSKVDVWTLIDSAVAVAAADHADELKARRDGIVEKLYSATSSGQLCRKCNDQKDPFASLFADDESDLYPFGRLLFNDEEAGLDDPFPGLCDELLKDPNLQDESMSFNLPTEQSSASLVGVGDSPQLNMPTKNYPNQGSGSSHSPNPQNWDSANKSVGSFASKAKADPPTDHASSAPPPNRQEPDSERLNSAGRRLRESYQAEKAKRRKSVQVIDFNELQNPKDTFSAKKDKGGGRNHP